MEISEVISALVYLGTETEDNPNLQEWKEIENVSLPLAFAVKFGFAELTAKGSDALNATYTFIKQVADERGLESVWDLDETDTPIEPRKMTITLDEKN
jgi:hypothetical protein